MNLAEILEKSYTGGYHSAGPAGPIRLSSYRARIPPPRIAWAGMALFTTLAMSVARAQPPSDLRKASREVAQEQFVCNLPGTSDRRIGIYRPPGGPQRCRVDYTRDGTTRSLWSAGHDYAFCVRKALEIVGLLEQARFKCSPQTREATAPIQ